MNDDINPYSSPQIDEQQPINYREVPHRLRSFLAVLLPCVAFGLGCGTMLVCLAGAFLASKGYASERYVNYSVKPFGGIGLEICFLLGFSLGAWMMYRAQSEEKKA